MEFTRPFRHIDAVARPPSRLPVRPGSVTSPVIEKADMKKIDQDELYQHLSAFLQNRGIEFKDGAYTQRVRKACKLLTDTVNFAQSTVAKAKTKVDQKLERMRQTIHEKTAPKPAEAPPAQAPAGAAPPPVASAACQCKPKPKARRTAQRTRKGRAAKK